MNDENRCAASVPADRSRRAHMMPVVIARMVLLMSLVTGALLLGPGMAYGAVDDELSVVDGKGRTLTVRECDTVLNGVAPLDRNRLTREWFHSGRAEYSVTGPSADTFAGTLQLGYQVGFPWSLGVKVTFSYTTPNALLDKTSLTRGPVQIITPNLLPGVSFGADLGNGPGIQEITTFSAQVGGSSGTIAVSGAHGTVTGAAGGVLLRPFARLISKAGDTVTSYGTPWNMN